MAVFELAVTAIVVLALVFSIVVYRMYLDKHHRSMLGAISFVLCTTFAILCIMVIPVDVYNVSYGIDANYQQTDPNAVHMTAEVIREMYFVIFIVLLFNGFFFLPFGFFHTGQEEDGCCCGTVGSLITSVGLTVIVSVEYFLLPDLTGTSTLTEIFLDDWNPATEFMMLYIANMAIFALTVWCTYVAYGMATFPVYLMTMKPDPPKVEIKNTTPKPSKEMREARTQIEAYESAIEFLESKQTSGNTLKKPDQKRLKDLKKKVRHGKRRLEAQEEALAIDMEPQGTASQPLFTPRPTAFQHCVECMLNPLRKAAGGLLLLVSWTMVVTMFIATLDRYQNSTCGMECGFILPEPSFFNPVDELFHLMAIIHADMFFFLGFVSALTFSTLFAVMDVNLSCCNIQLFRMEAKVTRFTLSLATSFDYYTYSLLS